MISAEAKRVMGRFQWYEVRLRAFSFLCCPEVIYDFDPESNGIALGVETGLECDKAVTEHPNVFGDDYDQNGVTANISARATKAHLWPFMIKPVLTKFTTGNGKEAFKQNQACRMISKFSLWYGSGARGVQALLVNFEV